MGSDQIFTIFGGTGDLTFRKLLPALYNIMVTKGEDAFAKVVIIGRRDYTNESYVEIARNWVEKFARLRYKEETFRKLAKRIVYYQMDFTAEAAYDGLDGFYKEMEAGSHIFYFAVAPQFFGSIVLGLKRVTGAEYGKVVIEKPFGENLAAATRLNKTMESFFKPDHIYRIDHYLGKEMVRNIQIIRFTNPIFTNAWDADHIECIQISAMEEVGVETRGGYYDHSGALKDMVQNHLLQILTIMAMEQPESLEVEHLHREQIKVLKAIRIPEDVSKNMVMAQYEGYREEPSVNPASETETYAALRLMVDNERWKGMPFYVRTGKKLGEREMQVVVVFKSPDSEVKSDILIIKIQPTEGVYLRFNIKKPGETTDISQANMDFCQSCSLENRMNTPEAYERLLYACMQGERSWFSQWDQVETSWKYVDGVRERYREAGLPICTYRPGSDGPEAAEMLLKRYGHEWFSDSEQ